MDISGSTEDDPSSSSTTLIATALGYFIGIGALLLYTPIVFRVYRQKHADGLAISTWWLKLVSYAFSDVYYITRGYNISTYIELAIITVQAAVVLGQVAYYQDRLDRQFGTLTAIFILMSIWGLTTAPEEVTAFGQLISVALSTGALLPQFWLNYMTRSKGDYSPLTASLASLGCAIRVWTTIKLNGGDPILLITYGSAFLFNFSLLLQILYYGVVVEGLTMLEVYAADMGKRKDYVTYSHDGRKIGHSNGGGYELGEPIISEEEHI